MDDDDAADDGGGLDGVREARLRSGVLAALHAHSLGTLRVRGDQAYLSRSADTLRRSQRALRHEREQHEHDDEQRAQQDATTGA